MAQTVRHVLSLTAFLIAFAFAGWFSHAQQGVNFPPILVQALNTTSDASGNFSITWNTNFQSATPFITARAVVPTPGNPVNCEVSARTSNTVTGWCRQSTPTFLNVGIITAGLTLNPFANVPATGTAIMIIGRDTTQ